MIVCLSCWDVISVKLIAVVFVLGIKTQSQTRSLPPINNVFVIVLLSPWLRLGCQPKMLLVYQQRFIAARQTQDLTPVLATTVKTHNSLVKVVFPNWNVPSDKVYSHPFWRGQSWQLCLCLYHSVCINSKLLICSALYLDRGGWHLPQNWEKIKQTPGEVARSRLWRRMGVAGQRIQKYKMKLSVG